MKNLEKNEMVLNFNELNKLDQFEQANVLWEIIERMGFKDATMEPSDFGYTIELECEEENEDTTFIVENIEWNTDEIDNQLDRELPTSVEISDDMFFDHFGEIVEINEENVTIFLNEEYMTEPKSFKIIL